MDNQQQNEQQTPGRYSLPQQQSNTMASTNENVMGPPPATGSRLYSKELRCMMYGFGDDRNPYTESVDLLEDLVIKYITEMTRKAMEVGRSGKITVDDIMYLVRRDPRKHARVKDLLLMNEELKKSRKAFDLEMLATQGMKADKQPTSPSSNRDTFDLTSETASVKKE